MKSSVERQPIWLKVNWGYPVLQLLSAIDRLSSLHPIAIIARKRLDISFFDIARMICLILKGIIQPPGCGLESARLQASLEISHAWKSASISRKRLRPDLASMAEASEDPDAVYLNSTSLAPFLSVRTAFDLYLKALNLPRGSLVVCSPLTIPDMVSILYEHGLVPLPVDLELSTLAPKADALEAEVKKRRANHGFENTEARVRAIYIAHVFGAQVDMTPIAEAAARCGVLLWEDCAQIFTGLHGYLGHPKSDAVFFSFGVIKRATAFGGGVARISDVAVMSDMLREEADYPMQSTTAYLRRVLKCFLLLACTSPLIYGLIVHFLRLMGVDHDKLAIKISKGFPKKGLLKAIRHRPSIPLVQMLAWRITRYTPEGVETRLRHCNRMLSVLEAALVLRNQDGKGAKGSALLRANDVLPGIQAHRHTLWLYPVMVKGRAEGAADRLVDALVREGFDATRSPTSLVPIDRCSTSELTKCPQGAIDPPSSSLIPKCSSMMDSLVYLPLANNIPDSEVDRMALVLARALSDTSFPDQAGRLSPGGEWRGAHGARGRAAVRSILAFACRSDAVALSICISALYVLFAFLAPMF